VPSTVGRLGGEGFWVRDQGGVVRVAALLARAELAPQGDWPWDWPRVLENQHSTHTAQPDSFASLPVSGFPFPLRVSSFFLKVQVLDTASMLSLPIFHTSRRLPGFPVFLFPKQGWCFDAGGSAGPGRMAI
jgi:hypothetical protein